eukprot:TRINITY_DN42343_c0_g1_i1.p1 TRINITY_DN42343_c0_g1~~TRINITY_DN42343_c0_g1_i1.p1  ORF type:complete len:417 (+),score=120.89 TRINITY_DN42343_c0_g1_i1:54-1304(+)
MPPPAPLHDPPKTIFEWFQNLYYWYDEANDTEGAVAPDVRKKDVMGAWCRFRRLHPDILATKDKEQVMGWVKGDWEGLRGRETTVVDLSCFREGEGEEVGEAAPVEEEKEEVVVERLETVESNEEPPYEGDDDEVEVSCKEEYFNSYWVNELQCTVDSWSPKDVRDFILALSRTAKPSSQPRLSAIAKAAYEGDTDGKLLEAGGVELLIQRTVGNVKWEASILRKESNHIMEALRQHKLKNSADYYKRSKRLQDIYSHSKLLPIVTSTLQPAPFEEVLYTNICSRESSEACDVKSLNDDVGKKCPPKAEHRYKVVSVTPHETPLEVSHNLVYCRDRTDTWVLMFSVDFMKHGDDAPSGHWHINRAPLGELIPHWGPSNSVFHGTPDSCPIWWQLIPKGMTYHSIPERNPLRSWLVH